jgi:hypothetical protein
MIFLGHGKRIEHVCMYSSALDELTQKDDVLLFVVSRCLTLNENVMICLLVWYSSYISHGRILRGGAQPPLRSFCTSPENFCTSPEKWRTSPWESFNDKSKWKFDIFGCLWSAFRKNWKFFCKIETVNSHSSLCQHTSRRWLWPVLSPNFPWGSWARMLHLPHQNPALILASIWISVVSNRQITQQKHWMTD